MPRAWSQARSAPATTASTVSLTVPPSAARTFLRSASDRSTVAKRRCSPIGTFSGLATDGRATASAAETMPAAVTPNLAAVFDTSVTVSRTASTAAAGRVVSSVKACDSSSTSVGSRRGRQLSSGAGAVSSVRSSITWAMSTADSPSTSDWWLLLTMAKLPSASPSTRYISHSGRLRSSGRLMRRATSSLSCSREPGLGSADRRTW